jgi:hypothetical protein
MAANSLDRVSACSLIIPLAFDYTAKQHGYNDHKQQIKRQPESNSGKEKRCNQSI